MADADSLANDPVFRAIAKVWEDLGGFCEAAVREAPEVNCQALGVAADDFAALTNQLDAALGLGALDRIEAAAREMTAAVTVGPNDLLRRQGITETDLAFLGALMMMRGQLRILDDSRAGEGAAAIALPTPTDDPGTASCDFCDAAAPAWYFPAEPFELPHAGSTPLTFGDRWYACEACRPLVAAADWKGLAARLGYPWPLPQTLKTGWLMFSRHRRGDVQRVPR